MEKTRNYPAKENARFVLCGCCEHYHQEKYFGDCRNDAERFTFYELEDFYGQGVWTELEV
jgi:hypothetical protein